MTDKITRKNKQAGGGETDREVMTLSEIASYLKVAEKSVLRMLRKGEIPGAKVGSQWRFLRSVVDDWLIARMQTVGKPALVNVIKTAETTMSLSNLVSPDLVRLGMEPGDKRAVLAQLIEPLVDSGLLARKSLFLRKLMAREQLVSTAVGHGVALPHVRAATDCPVAGPHVVVGICPEGTDFEALDGEKTRLFFLVCATREAVHLRLMAMIALIIRERGRVERLLSCKNKKDVVSILREIDKQIGVEA
ncbi:MAG: PTS sugar transporter subunit IIA [Kiritimatiellae bacterium]|nr:PTS sugar transporter subunit IIA [Kiritimatiellia bacterium]